VSRFEAGDRQEWREHFDPNVVWNTAASQLPAADFYHGHDGVERFFRDWLETRTDYEVAKRERLHPTRVGVATARLREIRDERTALEAAGLRE
jgi:ketosteroid isomerase-like protein